MSTGGATLRHIELILEQLANNSRNALNHKFRSITAEMAHKGLLRSGATIKARLAAMKQSAHDLIDEAVNQVTVVSATAESFILIQQAVAEHFDFLAGLLPRVASADRAEGKTAAGIFQKDKTDLMRQLALHGFSFRASASEKTRHIVAKDNDSGRNLPLLSNDDLKKWWKALGAERDSMTQQQLLARVRQDFPGHSITRDRIRALAKGRKPGPKPKLGGKCTA